MDLHRMLLCFISVIVLFCVSCNCTDEETETSGDQGGLLRHMWLLSMRDAKRKEKAVVDESNPAQGLISHQLLYCRVGIGFHLQILMNGSVWGVHEPSEYSFLRVFAWRAGVVGIRGVKSELYLCMNQEGIAHGMKKFSNECLFKERMEENHYNTYSSLIYTGFFLALSPQGQLRKGNKVGRHQACTHFLPRKHLLH
ncbi:fibroblast growth factor 4A isoform X1 [Chanodichthys erythropterus]|uniref:fibroblast growth factor 4A isoform X1 n=1 Tax=Chanodichthys erythropterus TaxID=933992 RepID=UPI00351EE027